MTGMVEIINIALGRLGESPIQSIEEGSVAANMAKIMYDPARRAALRDYNWNFAMRTERLAMLAVEAVDFRHAFSLPPDCLRAVRLSGNLPFVIRGSVLYADADDCILEYVADVSDPTLFDSDFVEALSFKLASDLAMPVKGAENLMSSFRNAYESLLVDAAALGGRETRVDLPENPYLDARNW